MSQNINSKEQKLAAKDFASDQDVRWCPGCGDYSVLAQVQRVMPELGVKKENIVWISGIGCSSRFPYYMNTYGFHTIHGRAAAIASGLKLHKPELSVWVATGDGDLLSIGGNHFIHTCRKNMDLKIICFNNRIYGLTKGQYSPTSEKGKITKSTPFGSIDFPFNPISLALGSGATFVARSIDREPKHLLEMIKRAGGHTGVAFVEVFQNCNIFNDGAYEHLTDKEVKEDNVLVLENDKPMIFGKNKTKGIKLDGLTPIIVDLTDGKISANDLFIHKENDENLTRAFILSHLSDNKNFPTPIGIFRQVFKPTYDQDMHNQIETIKKKKGEGTMEELLTSSNSWTVN